MQFRHVFLTITILLSFLHPSFAQDSTILEHGGAVRTVVFSPVNGFRVASAGEDKTIKIWNLRNDTVITLKGHLGAINSVVFSPDGSLLASGGENHIKLWNVHRQKNIATFEHILGAGLGASPVLVVAFSPDGQLLASAGYLGVKLWNVANRTEVATLQHDNWITAVAFSPDGQFLVTGGSIGDVKIWDVQKRQVIAQLDNNGAAVGAVAFSPNGQTLVSAGEAGIINFWDALHWKFLGALQNNGIAFAVDFAPDGKTLATTGYETVNLWSAENGEKIASLTGHANWVRGVAFTPSGNAIASGGDDGTVRVQNIRTHLEHPRNIVRLIYFLPLDREPQPDIDTKLDTLIKDVQQFYAEQMHTHGFGRKTFTLETDPTGKAVVHHVNGRFTDRYYHNETLEKVEEEIEERFDLSKNIYLISIDTESELIDIQWCGRGGVHGTVGGRAIVPASGGCFVGNFGIDVTAHELGHAFGLNHDFRNDAYLMSYGDYRNQLSYCAAEWLDPHRYFNTGQTYFSEPTTVEMLPPRLVAPPNAIRLRFKVTDPDGCHQAQLHTQGSDGYNSLLGCKRLKGNPRTTVEFVTTDLTPESESVSLQVIDVHGNISWSKSFPIDITALLPRPEVVSIPDPHLAEAVRQEIGNSITTHTMLNLTMLDVPNLGITDLTGLEHAHNLRSLNLGGEYVDGQGDVNRNVISDFSLISRLTQLKDLNLSVSSLSDVSFLARLTQLTSLHLSNNALSDVSALSGLTQLIWLNLGSNTLPDVSELSGLTQLTWLNLGGNTLSDVSALARLTQLTSLYLWNNTLSDVTPLSGLTQLTSLDLGNNTLSDVSALSGLTQLTRLYLGGNALSDVSALAGLTQLTALNLSNNTLSDVSALSGLTQLTWLSLGNNTLSDVTSLVGLTQLTSLHLWGNAIFDVSPLTPLTQLKGSEEWHGLYLHNNPLNYASLHTHIPAMQVKGVNVQFDERTPTTLVKRSGAAQQATVDAPLPLPFVVEVRDERNHAFAGVPVTFTVTAGTGRLSATTATTDASGIAQAHLTLGRTAGTTTVRVTVPNLSQPVQFTATALLPSAPVYVPDVNLRAQIAATLGKARDSLITVADMLTLTALSANNANIRELTGLQHASNLTTLSLDNNNLFDVAPLAALTQLETLSLNNNNLSDVTFLARLTHLKTLSLNNNNLADIEPLVNLSQLKTLYVRGNLLSYPSLHIHLPAIQASGAATSVDSRTPITLVKHSGTHGVAGTAFPIVVEVQDEHGFEFSGVPVTFTVTAGGGHLSAANIITDSTGRARTTLTLGEIPGKNTVLAAAVEMPHLVRFTITTIDASTPVAIPDAALRTKISEILSKPLGTPLTAGDMLALTTLEVRNANIRNLTGLEHAHNLRSLNLGGEYVDGQGDVNRNAISDFSLISRLTQLRNLNLSVSSLSDVSFLARLTQLTSLHLSNNALSDVSTLSGLTQLTGLHLFNNTISDVSVLSGLTQLTSLYLSNNTISDVSALGGLTRLAWLSLGNNTISDVSALAGLTRLTWLSLGNNTISDVSALVGLTQLTTLYLWDNAIFDVSPLTQLTQLKGSEEWHGLYLQSNPLNYASLHAHIPAMEAKGVNVRFDERVYPALDIIAGAGQQGPGGEPLANPLVVAAIDAQGTPMRGVAVTFAVLAGGGTLSTTAATTNASGRAQTTLTLGPKMGSYRVLATAGSLVTPSTTFIAIATGDTRPEPAHIAADVNGDGVVNIQDLVLVSLHLGQPGENRADVNGDKVINIQDLVLVAGAFRDGAAAPTLHPGALAQLNAAEVQLWLLAAQQVALPVGVYVRGVQVLERLLAALLPQETVLLANYPNPFNPETWVPYQLSKPADVTLTIYAVNGAVVRRLALGHQPAGIYQSRSRAAHWDGRNTQGERVASGVYFYTLTASEFSATRKMLIRK